MTSRYDTLLKLLEGFDASGRAEIFRLLLERRSTIPLFLPNGEHHLSILRLLNKTIGSDQSVCIGEDTNLLRLTVISCRQKEDSQTAELLKGVLHLNSLHWEDFSEADCNTRESTTAEIGLGCLLPQTGNRDLRHLLVLNIVGDFDPLWDFIKVFSDCLIIEDSTNEEERFHRRPKFSAYKGSPTCLGLEGIGSVLVWNVSHKVLVAKAYIGNENEFGFQHVQMKAPLNTKLYNEIVKSLVDPQAFLHSNKNKMNADNKMMLYEMVPLFSKNLKEIECSIPYDIQSSIKKVKDFSTLRTDAFILQKSFNDQAKYEEEKTKNRNNESIINETKLKIKKQVALRKEKAPTVEQHPLLDSFVKLLSLEDASLRVLGVREMEKLLNTQSEKAVRPWRLEIDRLSSHFAELSQSKMGQNDQLEVIKNNIQIAKDKYNSTIVGIEHLWRELSQLFAANPSKCSKLTS